TVEFLVDDDTGEFFFLEVNTRLQVEHPVTECVTGIDLVREQLKIAAGEPLEYEQSDITWTGSSIEARLYAEDPGNDFLPATGTLVGYEPAVAPELRWDSGVERGSVVGTDFDPMLAKVISYGPTREEAAGRLALGLERSHLAGVVTNRDFLVETLRSAEFLAGDTTTDFIGRVDPARKPVRSEAECERMSRMAALWIQGENRDRASVWKEFRSGWLSGRMPSQEVTLRLDGESRRIQYQSIRDGRFRFEGGDHARIQGWSPHGLDAEIEGHRCRVRITRDDEMLYLHGPRGDFSFVVEPRFILPGTEETAGGFVASMPGKVIEIRAQVGDRVEAGDTVLILEAMKMEHPVRATEAGVVSQVLVEEGEQVEAGALLLVVEEAEA
ncbi:MAG: biotin/lipoyl-containing protein, partial [Myxococcota bacterium]|nr:biotin/lipoyl-containing protein [Myxococcota bacterium]